MEPISIHVANQLAGQAAQDQVAQQVNPLENPGEVTAEDQARFQNAMQPEATNQVVAVQELGDVQAVSAVNGVQPEQQVMGDVILDSLQRIKTSHDSGMERVQAIMGQEQIATKDMLQLQFELTAMNIELETAGKMADKSSQGVQSMMRNQ